MPDKQNWYLEVALPALLRAARNTYGSAIRTALAPAGFDDIPRNGIYVIGAIARSGAPLSQIIAEMGMSKQAAGQLVDSLVLRGYLDRSVDNDDRRRLTISLTERGAAAAAASRTVIDRIEQDLIARVGAASVAQTRKTLAVLAHLGRGERATAESADRNGEVS